MCVRVCMFGEYVSVHSSTPSTSVSPPLLLLPLRPCLQSHPRCAGARRTTSASARGAAGASGAAPWRWSRQSQRPRRRASRCAHRCRGRRRPRGSPPAVAVGGWGRGGGACVVSSRRWTAASSVLWGSSGSRYSLCRGMRGERGRERGEERERGRAGMCVRR